MPDIVVLDHSGSHNLNVLLEAHQQKALKDGRLKLVVTSQEKALGQARKANVYTLNMNDNQETDESLAQRLSTEHHTDLVVVLDWPHALETTFVERFPNKVIGIHPALSGQFPGNEAVQQAYEAYRNGDIKWSGCNLHYVAPDGHAGDIIRQLVVPVEPKDTLERFEARMRKSEAWVLLKGVKQILYEMRTRKKRRNRNR